MEEKGEKCFEDYIFLVAISKCLAERISEEKGVSQIEAENIVVDCIKYGIKTIKE